MLLRLALLAMATGLFVAVSCSQAPSPSEESSIPAPAAASAAAPQPAKAAPSADRQAVPMTPFFANYWGKVTVDGAGASVGAVVEAYSPRGDLVGRFTVNTAGFYGYMRVYGEDATPSALLPGMRAGETITFKVKDKPAATVPSPAFWQNNPEPTEIDLSASGG